MVDVKKNITVRDVAAKSGVSVATVSNVINGVDKVSEETKKHVLRVMEELNYHLNLTARSLAKNKSNLIGIMLPITEQGYDMSLLLRDNPFYAEFISGAEYKAMENDYDILITGVRPGQSCSEWINKRNIDGAIFIGNYSRVIAQDVKKCNAQLVLVDTYDEGTNTYHTIGVDDELGGYLATEHLLKLGHRNIVFAASNVWADGVVYRRFVGYKKAMSEYGLDKINHLILQDTLTLEGGYNTGIHLINSMPEISAVFAAADIMAFGIMKAFYEKNKTIPADLSIVGFDNVSTCEYTYPGLTSVSQPIYKKGLIAVEMLIDAIDSEVEKNEKVILPIELVQRHSTMQIKI